VRYYVVATSEQKTGPNGKNGSGRLNEFLDLVDLMVKKQFCQFCLAEERAPMIWSTELSANGLNFALVIAEKEKLRHLIVEALRDRGWLVHGISRAEQAFAILAHIPYSLIILDSELPGICATDFVRVMRNSREWRAIRLVVITDAEAQNLTTEIAQCGAFLARRSRWQKELDEFLSDYKEDPKPSNACSRV
jgi:PleD family two-component response regulator